VQDTLSRALREEKLLQTVIQEAQSKAWRAFKKTPKTRNRLYQRTVETPEQSAWTGEGMQGAAVLSTELGGGKDTKCIEKHTVRGAEEPI
jgi:hypothetical protein